MFRLAKLGAATPSFVTPLSQDVVVSGGPPQGPVLSAKLVGQTIRYRDSARQGKITECKVLDYGLNYWDGQWYMVDYSDDKGEMRISAGEMTDILNARV